MTTEALSIEIRQGWTPTQAGILEFVAKGASISAAAAALGIHRDTIYHYRNTVPGFSEALKQAEGIAEVNYTLAIHAAAKSGDWNAARFWLSRRRRELYGDNIDIDIDTRINRLLANLEQNGKTAAPVGVGAKSDGNESAADNPAGSENSGQRGEPGSPDPESGPVPATD